MQDNLFSDFLLSPTAFWVDKVIDAVSPFFPAVNNVADPQRWLLLSLWIFNHSILCGVFQILVHSACFARKYYLLLKGVNFLLPY